MQSFCVFIRHIPGTKNLLADWLSRMVSTLSETSVEEFVMHGVEYADVSCLMAMMISTEEESVSVATVIPDYIEEEGVSRPMEFTPDFEDALEEIWNSRDESAFQDGRGMRQDLGAIPNTVPPQQTFSIPGVPSKILKRREVASIQEPMEPVREQVDDTSDPEEQTSEVQRPA